MEYFLLVLSFIISILGIFGDTSNNGRLNNLGYGVLIFLVLLFVFTCRSLYNKEHETDQIKRMGKIQILNGLNKLLNPLTHNNDSVGTSNFFSFTKDSAYLSILFDERIYSYKEDSVNIDEGVTLITNAISVFNNDLDKKTIQYSMDILTDEFFKKFYSFKNPKFRFVLDNFFAIKTVPRKYGDFYRTAGDDKYYALYNLIIKFEKLSNYLNNGK